MTGRLQKSVGTMVPRGWKRYPMARQEPFIPNKLKPWIDARRRHRLSHTHVQMARELGLNPKKLGKIDNHEQERWKAPLPQFIEYLYLKRFGRNAPQTIRSIEQIAAAEEAKRQGRKKAKAEQATQTMGAHGEAISKSGDGDGSP